jgi:glutathione S-transferase
MMRVFGVSISGNCYKVRLALEQLGLPYEWNEVDMMAGATHSPSFLAMNPNAKVPVLEIEPGKHLPESDAILFYLADGTPLLPSDRLARAQVLQWMFFEQYSHEPYVAVARFIVRFLEADHPRRVEMPRLLERGHQALAVMETQLHGRKYFVGDTYSIADIALYAYTHAAPEAGFDLSPYPAVRAWLTRVESTPRFVPMAAG